MPQYQSLWETTTENETAGEIINRYAEIRKRIYPRKPYVPKPGQVALPPLPKKKYIDADAKSYVAPRRMHSERYRDVDLKLWGTAIAEVTEELTRAGKLDIDHLLQLVCIRYGWTRDQITGPARGYRFMQCRFEFCFLARRMGYSITRIGQKLNRDHTTALHASRQYERWIRCSAGEARWRAGDNERSGKRRHQKIFKDLLLGMEYVE